jgi:hypothetical protein
MSSSTSLEQQTMADASLLHRRSRDWALALTRHVSQTLSNVHRHLLARQARKKSRARHPYLSVDAIEET